MKSRPSLVVSGAVGALAARGGLPLGNDALAAFPEEFEYTPR
jgi:hypothetical protein